MKAPVEPFRGEMDYAGGVAALGPMRRLSASLPRPSGPYPEGSELPRLMLIPVAQAQEIAPAVGTS